MKSCRIYLSLCFLLLALCASAQSKKNVKKYKIRSVTETVTAVINGKEITYVQSNIIFNPDGEEISVVENNPDGSTKTKESTTYDKDGYKIQESIYKVKDASDAKLVNKKTVFKYNAEGDKTEEIQYDAANKIIKREVYEYNALGQKNIETAYNAEGKITKKETITFNEKGLKSEKKTYDSRNALIEIKKYIYEFYK